jgi:MYXO-CTERM domain-containing protein
MPGPVPLPPLNLNFNDSGPLDGRQTATLDGSGFVVGGGTPAWVWLAGFGLAALVAVALIARRRGR